MTVPVITAWDITQPSCDRVGLICCTPWVLLCIESVQWSNIRSLPSRNSQPVSVDPPPQIPAPKLAQTYSVELMAGGRKVQGKHSGGSVVWAGFPQKKKKWSLPPITLPLANVITTNESLLWFSWDLTCLLRLPWLWRVIERLSGSAYHRVSATFWVNASPGCCILRNSQKDQASWRQAAPTGSAWLAAFPQNNGGSLSSEWFPGQTLLDRLWYIVQKPRRYWAVRLCYLRRIVYVLWIVHRVSFR